MHEPKLPHVINHRRKFSKEYWLEFNFYKHDQIEKENGLKYILYTAKTRTIAGVFRFHSFRLAKVIVSQGKTNAFAMQND